MSDDIDSAIDEALASGTSVKDLINQARAEVVKRKERESSSFSMAPRGPGPWRGQYEGAQEYAPAKRGFFDRLAEATAYPEESKLIHELPPEAQRDHAIAAAGTLAGMGAGGLAGRALAPALKGAGAVVRMLGAGAEGAVGGGVGGGVEAGLRGEDALAGAGRGALVGGVVGGGAQGLAELGKGASKGVRGMSKWVRQYGEAKDAGHLARIKGTSSGEAGVQELADKAQTDIFAKNANKIQAAGKAHAATVAESAADQDVTPIVSRLSDVAAKNRTVRTGKVRNKELDSAVDEIFDLMDIDAKTGMARTEDILAARRIIDAKAQLGQPATRENAPYRELRSILKEGLHEANPALAQADDAFRTQADESERLTDVLARTEQTNIARGVDDAGAPDMRAGKEVTAAQRIRRIGDETIAGSAEERQLREVMDMDPAYREALENVLAKKAQAATSIGAAKVSDRLPALLNIPGMPFLAQNSRFIGARVIDPAGKVAAKVGEVGAKTLPAVAAAKREQDRRRAEALKKGGRK